MAEIGLKANALFEVDEKKVRWQSLKERYLVPPFSTLDARSGYWQDRKREWIGLGIKSEVGRGKKLTYQFPWFDSDRYEGWKKGEVTNIDYGTSIFDPVVCEVSLKWYCPEGGKVFDPFAGGSVRGVVSGMLGHPYIGIDLSAEQIEANIANEKEVDVASYGGIAPQWFNDDSLNMDKYVEDGSADFMLTCPPYFDVEVYSDDPRDISNMTWEGFVETYTKILAKAAAKVKDNRFAVVVIGDVRDQKNGGACRDFQGVTHRAMESAGFMLYNELILLNAVGSASLRVDRQFKTNRKNVRIHQYVMVYYKGDVSKIRELF